MLPQFGQTGDGIPLASIENFFFTVTSPLQSLKLFSDAHLVGSVLTPSTMEVSRVTISVIVLVLLFVLFSIR
jgi:hypothetical protein